MKRIKPALTLCIITLLSTVGLSLGDDLETYKATYEKKLEEIMLDHRTKTVELDGQYLKGLHTLRTRVREQGDLEKVNAVTKETERFIEAKTVSEGVARDTFPDLRRFQQSYIIQAKSLKLGKAKQIISLAENYDRALGRLQKEFTRAEKLDDATLVLKEREKAKNSADVTSARKIMSEYAKQPDETEAAGKTVTKQPLVDKTPGGGKLGLESVMDMFSLYDKGWVFEDDYITGKCGYTERFHSKPFRGKNIHFGFKIKAKWYHGILINVDGTECFFSRGHFLNEATAIGVKDKNGKYVKGWERIKGIVRKRDEFVSISAKLQGNRISWYYDGKLVTKTKFSKSAIGERTLKVGFACHSTSLQLKDFFLKKDL